MRCGIQLGLMNRGQTVRLSSAVAIKTKNTLASLSNSKISEERFRLVRLKTTETPKRVLVLNKAITICTMNRISGELCYGH